MATAPQQSPVGQAPRNKGLLNKVSDTTLSLGPILVGFALLCTAVALSGCDVESAQVPDTVRPVRTAVVNLSDQAAVASYPGTIQAQRESQLGFRVAGKVAARYVQVGDKVAPGTALAKLEQEDLSLRLRAAEAQVRGAAADAEQARIDVKRYTQIKDSPAFSQAVFDKRVNTLEAAEARLKDAQSQAQLAKNQLEYSTLVADDFGVVTATSIEPGQVVAAGQTAITLARSAELDVAVSIPETRLADLSRANANVSVWSQPGEKITARVREVAASADPVTRTYAVRFALDELPETLQIGMSATLTLAAKSDGAVAEVPLSAVFEHKGQSTVWTVDTQGGLHIVPVTIAGYRGGSALIANGLKDGDVVVTAGVHKLDEAQKVRPLENTQHAAL
ncbi:MAG: efflux RND transporter periplasmic adaptor subunit [Rhodospirillaceae bacterium]|nr:efflux RND transporter periplasmic adaptor subunit [Rhodospirillaceae bacterium]